MYEPSHLSLVDDDAASIEFERPVQPAAGPHPSTPADPTIWPEVFTVPSGPGAAVAAVVAGRLLRRRAARLPMRLVFPDGTAVGAGGHAAPVLLVNHPDRLARRLGRHGAVGFGKSYMAGEWESTDLVGVLIALAPALTGASAGAPRRLTSTALAAQTRSSRPGRNEELRNIAAHFDDVSSDLFGEFLDETMTYSCALFDQLPGSWPDLAAAQRRKIDRLLDAAGVGPGTRLLEIGTGWGELSIRAATRGADVHSIAASERQARLARQRVLAAGQSDRVRIAVCDYLDISGSYDAVISVEMIEAVGHRSWPDFLRTVGRAVKPQGRVVIQAIANPHKQMLATLHSRTWTQKYIFPGGVIPSGRALLRITQRETGLSLFDMSFLGEHYAETLRLWRERFLQRRKTLAHIGFDDVFARMWELHLAGREAGFRSGALDLHQWTFVNKGER